MLKSIELPSVTLLAGPVSESLGESLGENLGESLGENLAATVRTLLESPDLDHVLEDQRGLEEEILHSARTLARRAYPGERAFEPQAKSTPDDQARAEVHRTLLALYQQHVQLPVASSLVNQFHPFPLTLLRELERPWERDMLRRAHIRHDLSGDGLPANPAEFAEWYRNTAFAHPLYEHELYAFLASEASLEGYSRLATRDSRGLVVLLSTWPDSYRVPTAIPA